MNKFVDVCTCIKQVSDFFLLLVFCHVRLDALTSCRYLSCSFYILVFKYRVSREESSALSDLTSFPREESSVLVVNSDLMVWSSGIMTSLFFILK